MTTPVWTQVEMPARDLAAGDVIAAKDGRLWAVTSVAEDGGAVILTITRGEQDRTMTRDADYPIPTLLNEQDARALALVADQLGAVSVGRAVA